MSTSDKTTKRALQLQIIAFLIAMLGTEKLFGWYAAEHFTPQTTFRAAHAAGDNCIVLIGDSRMVAGFDEASMKAALSSSSKIPCVVNLAIGALDIQGIGITLREYLASGRRPRGVVLGMTGDSLLAYEKTIDPSTFIGNRAVQLSWSRLSDVFHEYPGFPFAGIQNLDQGFRFLTQRMTSFGTYASLAWQKIQTIQDRLTFRKVSERNQFGLVEDMRAMGDRERLRARTRIREFATGSVKLNPWLMEMSSSLLTLKIPFFIVELPVMRDFRQNVGDTPEAAIFRVRLNESLTSTGTRFFNLSSPPWIEDTYFPDGLHLTRAGAKLFSKDLGALLGKHSTD